MKVGVWFYGLGSVLTGILTIVWGAFDASHQPIQSLGINLPGQHILAYVAGMWLVIAGLAILSRRTATIAAVASAIAYLFFAASWLARYYPAIHTLGWRTGVVLGITAGFAQQAMLISPAVIVYASASEDPLFQKRAAIAARWMLGLPPIIFGLFHLLALSGFATFVPHWIPFGYFWAALTGTAFILAGCAICSGKMDLLALRLLALMLLLFEVLVEIPPVFAGFHKEPTWGAAIYNVTAIGACLIFAEFLANREDTGRIGTAENLLISRRDPSLLYES